MAGRPKRRHLPKSEPGKVWAPHPGPQMAFLTSSADEVLFGGAAGGGKSMGLLMGAIRYIAAPHYRALLLRRTFPELQSSLIDRSREIYPSLGGTYNKNEHTWTFASGAKVIFRSLEHEGDEQKFRSDEFQFVGYDELSTFSERQYRYLFTRLRSPRGIKSMMRAASNPGGPGHDWLLKRFAPWLYPPGVRTDEYEGPYAAPGEKLYFLRGADEEDILVPRGTPGALSRVFIPATVQDNPTLIANDPGYLDRLESLDPLTRRQLKHGDWMARSQPGEFFRREWFEGSGGERLVERGPEGLAVARVRYWDRAATDAKTGTTPDWTAGLLLSRDRDGLCFIEDVVRFQGGPAEVERRILDTARRDKLRWGDVRVVLERDPAQAGKFEAHHYVTHVLAAFDVHAIPPQGDKMTRAKPVSAQAEHGNIKMVRAHWNEALLAELEQFPLGKKDQVDALSGAYSQVLSVATGQARTGGGSQYRGAMGGF